MAERSRFDLDGRVALVTGGASGLGRAISVGLAEAGARVTVADVNETGAAETVAAIGHLGGTALAVRCDVSRADDVRIAFDRAQADFGTVDILVNDAMRPPSRRACPTSIRSRSGRRAWEST